MKTDLFNPATAGLLLNYQLAKMYDQAEVASLLGIQSEKSEDFWKDQRRTVVHRFFAYLLSQAKMELTIDIEQLTVEQFGLVTFLAQQQLKAGLTYATVRAWWLSEGAPLHTVAFDSKRLRSRRANQCLRLVAIIPGVGMRYARIDFLNDSVQLFEEVERDKGLIVPLPEAELDTAEYRQRLCESFQHFKDGIGAKEIKYISTSL